MCHKILNYNFSRAQIPYANSIRVKLKHNNNNQMVMNIRKIINISLLINSICYVEHFYNVEPVGSVSPKINEVDELSIVRTRKHSDVRLLCPAQSYPVPSYR